MAEILLHLQHRRSWGEGVGRITPHFTDIAVYSGEGLGDLLWFGQLQLVNRLVIKFS